MKHTGTASELMAQQLQINGVLLDNVGLCILTRYGMIKRTGYQPRKTLENGRVAKGKPARVYELESKEGFVVSLGEAEATQAEATQAEATQAEATQAEATQAEATVVE